MMVSRFNGKYSKRVSIKVLILIFISIAIAGCLNTVQDSAEDRIQPRISWMKTAGTWRDGSRFMGRTFRTMALPVIPVTGT
jgi:hypothetical protein